MFVKNYNFIRFYEKSPIYFNPSSGSINKKIISLKNVND